MKTADEKQLDTLKQAILVMSAKIEEQIPVFEEAELAQEVMLGHGETTLRQNPIISEFRALVKDYGVAIKAYRDLSNGQQDELSALDGLRQKFKVVK